MIYKILNRKLKNEKNNLKWGGELRFLEGYAILALCRVTLVRCRNWWYYASRPLTPFSTIFPLYLVLNLNRSTMGKPLTRPLVTDTLYHLSIRET